VRAGREAAASTVGCAVSVFSACSQIAAKGSGTAKQSIRIRDEEATREVSTDLSQGSTNRSERAVTGPRTAVLNLCGNRTTTRSQKVKAQDWAETVPLGCSWVRESMSSDSRITSVQAQHAISANGVPFHAEQGYLSQAWGVCPSPRP
jgi:hypothetical protein